MKRTWTCLAMGAAMVLLASTVSTKAAELKIWMDQFKADYASLDRTGDTLILYQNPASGGVADVPGNMTGWQGWAPVNLPVGSVIQSVVYYHIGSTNLGHTTSCQLYRVKFGKPSESLANGHSQATVPETVTLTMTAEDKNVIKPGYRYFISIYISVSASMRGVKIIY